MIFSVHFTDTGIEKELDFDTAPQLHDVLTIEDGGIEDKFWVVSVSGAFDSDGKTRPGRISVKPLDEKS